MRATTVISCYLMVVGVSLAKNLPEPGLKAGNS